MKNAEIIKALTEIVDRTVIDYRSDFDIDLEHLARYPDSPFVFYARAGGTHMYSEASVKSGKAAGWKNYSPCAYTIGREHDGRDGSGWFFYEAGMPLRRITTERAARLIQQWYDAGDSETPEHYRARMLRGGW